ncbi:MAG: filamentous hemagglutinin N-terminal domain-containing protein, partial [Rhodoferax sp.]|nr:filamentous hemagglutinin N-terminal domain-containing protein [Rhodoferax sp.]
MPGSLVDHVPRGLGDPIARSCNSLNHIFRTVWNDALGAMVAVAEIDGAAAGRSVGRRRRGVRAAAAPEPPPRLGLLGLSLALALVGVSGSSAWANPGGASAIVGSASLSTQGNTLTVTTQNGPGLNHSALNWQSFSIPTGSTTHFLQPSAGSTVINRVLGSDPSQIYGTLSSNGRLVLVNPAGITVGAGAYVDTAGFTASTLRMSEADALAGRLRFGDASVPAGLSVAGRILARSGDAVLIAPSLDIGADALIQAPDGSTLLAAGRQLEITARGLEGIHFQLQAPTDQALNLGTLSGNAVGIFAGTLRHSGQIRADAVTVDGGRIVLKAAGDAWVRGAGRLVARAKDAAGQETGGRIDVLGQRVGLTDQAVLDASGAAGGGVVRVGGDYQGKNPDVPNATATYMGPEVQIRADAQQQGDGGRVIVWADDRTAAYGRISARGGEQGGNGGFVEVSGGQGLRFSAIVDLRALNGQAGLLLLDPRDIRIDLEQAGTVPLSDVDAFADLAGSDAVVSVAALAAATGTVQLKATRDILFQAPVTLTANHVGLSAQAGRHVQVSAAIATQGGAVSLVANDPASGQANGAGEVSVSAPITTLGGGITLRSHALAAQATSGAGVRLDAALVAGSGAITLEGVNSGILQTGGYLQAGSLQAQAGGGDLQLDRAGNQVGSVNLTATGALSLVDSGALNVSAFSLGSSKNLSLVAGGALSLPSGAIDTGSANLSLSSGGTLSTPGALSGANVTLSGATGLTLGHNVTASGTLSLSAATSGGISQTAGAITATGATTVTAGAGAAVSLNQSGNNFSSVAVTAATSAVTLRDSNALVLGSTSAASLTVVSGGSLTQSGALTVTGATDLTATAGDITLGTASNNFNTVSASAAAGSLSLTDSNALTMTALTLGSSKNLSLVAGGALSLPSGAIDTGSANLSLSSGGTLSTPGA